MSYHLEADDIELLLESLAYAKRAVESAPDTPSGVRAEKVARIERVIARLRSPPGHA